MNFYRDLLRPLLFRLDAEVAHELTITAMRMTGHFPALLRAVAGAAYTSPSVRLFGLDFRNPVGLAAGVDKNALALPAWDALGFGFVEVGTVTALAQPGNPRPRCFRYPAEGALVNRMGFNNRGADAMAENLRRLRKGGRWPSIPVGINIGKSKVTPPEEAHKDYLLSFGRLLEYGDFFIVNVSSPNTPGLRALQDETALARILRTLRARDSDKPLLVKIAPDLPPEHIAGLAVMAAGEGASGFVATNTTLDHSAIPATSDQQGGLSGSPLRGLSDRALIALRAATDLPIIASGGVMDPDSAKAKISLGAQLVEVYTGLVYSGPPLVREICAALDSR